MSKKQKKALLVGIVLCLCLLVALEAWRNLRGSPSLGDGMLYSLITAGIGSAMFLMVILYNSFTPVLKINGRALPSHLAMVLPCLAVAINNFPIIPFFSGKAYLGGEPEEILLYFVLCMATGLFEELLFRGYILMILLENRQKSKRGTATAVIVSSAVFGGVHLLNLFAGADPLSTLLQVGYSFLVGGMCAILLLKTGTVWYAVLIHGVYNFAGGVIPRFGGGILWDAPTVVVTTILSLVVGGYMIFLLTRINEQKMDCLFTRKAEE